MNSFCIGIDIGTSNICGIIFNLDLNKIQEIINIKNTSNLKTENKWENIQDPKNIYKTVKELIDKFIKKYNSILGIGITGQMHGILYINEAGEPISPLYTWQDSRGNLIFENNLSYSDFLFNETGYFTFSGFGLATHFFNLKNKLTPNIKYKVATIMDFVVMKLIGSKKAVTDVTNAAGIGLFNNEKLKFDTDAIKSVGIDTNILPQIIPSFNFVGKYNKNINVYNAIGDNQANFLGAVNDIKNSVLINIGTGSQISIFSDKCYQHNSIETRPFPGGGYLLVGSGLCGGSSLSLLKTFFENSIEFFIGQTNNIYFYEKINLLEISDEIKNDLLNVKVLFRGTRFNSKIKGSIEDIKYNNLTPENLILGFLKGISNELNNYYKLFPLSEKKKIENFIGSGNAIRLNNILRKIIENDFNCKLNISKIKEEAAFGALLTAIIGEKIISNTFSLNDFIN